MRLPNGAGKIRYLRKKWKKLLGQTALRMLKRIEAHGEENFSALAWILERRFPSDFSRPEVQMNLAVQNNINSANGSGDLELVVIRDLEYGGLRKREGYTHHAEEGVKDIDAQVVPEEVSGYLTRDGSEASGQIISESQAAHLNQRAEEISAKIGKMIRKYRPEFGNSEGSGKEELYNGAGK
jgi:hypothetical protein